jgi:hypothetical protein
MTDNSGALKASRRRDSATKRRRAAEVLQAMVETGEPITFPAVARRAGVSVSLLYADADLVGRLSEARSRQQVAGSQRAWRLPARSLVTEQSLRADLANANDQVRRLREEVALLRERMARALGDDADRASGRTTSPLLDELEERTADLEADNAQLRGRIAELETALRETNETLGAARAVNRQLMGEINRPTRPASPGGAAPGARSQGDRKPRRSV